MTNSSPAQGKKAAMADGKLPYETPKLTVFGSVRDLTGGSSGPVGDGTGMNMAPSDRALKENVVQIGEHAKGFGLYLFDYKQDFQASCGTGRQFGVMADEVATVVPEAVSLGSNGYAQVDYDLLGITRH